MGPDVVKIVCGEGELLESGRSHDVTRLGYFPGHMSSTFIVHKGLLCRYSRYFREKLYGSLESEVVADAVMDIEEYEEKYLSYEDVPAGYVPSWVTFVENYRQQARELSPEAEKEQPPATEQQAEEAIPLPNESKRDFMIFAHWLYMPQVVLDDQSLDGHSEIVCARMYGLAERLDVPALRRQCYEALHKYYAENNTMPEPQVVEVILKNCQATSLLRKYMVAAVAHEVINSGSESKDSCDPILALDKSFAAEVALEIMDRLRSDGSSKDPNEEEKFDMDDSDSDVCSSDDGDSDIDYDSDEDMTISEGEEEESVIGDAPKKPLAAVEAPQSSSELSSLDSDHEASIPASRPPTIHESLPRVKIEIDSRANRALLDVNANKRKRANHSFGDDENPRTKRLETTMADDVDFVDLTKWASSD
jgi:hypothetical protein